MDYIVDEAERKDGRVNDLIVKREAKWLMTKVSRQMACEYDLISR